MTRLPAATRWWLVGPLSVGLLAGACGRKRAKPEGDVPARGLDAGAAKPPAAKTPGIARQAEVHLGLPVYPGATLDPESVQQLEMGAYYQRHELYSTDAPPEKVALFYRAKLKAMAPGPDAVVETRVADKTTFILKRDVRNLRLVAIEPTEGTAGSDIQLTATGAGNGADDAGGPGAR